MDRSRYFVVHAQTGSRGGTRPFNQRPPWVRWSGDITSRQRWSAWLLLGVADSFEAAVDMAWEPRNAKAEAAYTIDFEYTITSFKRLNWKLADAEYYFVPETDGLYNATRFQSSWEDTGGNTAHYLDRPEP